MWFLHLIHVFVPLTLVTVQNNNSSYWHQMAAARVTNWLRLTNLGTFR